MIVNHLFKEPRGSSWDVKTAALQRETLKVFQHWKKRGFIAELQHLSNPEYTKEGFVECKMVFEVTKTGKK